MCCCPTGDASPPFTQSLDTTIPRVLCCAVGYAAFMQLELADRIGAVRGGCTTAELAASIGAGSGGSTAAGRCSEENLGRLLRAAASLGYFRLDTGTGKWRNTAASAALRRDHPNGCRALPLHLVEDTYECWSRLLDSVTTGRSNFAIPSPVAAQLGIPPLHTPPGAGDAVAVVSRAGTTAPVATGSDLVAVDLWRWYQARGAHSVQFNEAMTAVDALGWYAQTHDYPWGRHTRAVDVGGSLGSLLAHILAAHTGLRGLLFDQPHVIAEARPVWAAKHAALLPRVDFAGGSFFDAPTLPPAADGDVWFMRNILHDWSDDHAATILANIRTAFASARATLALVEVTPADVGDVPARCLLDLHMMVVVRGKERTPRQWEALLRGAGFALVRVHDTRSLVRVVEAVPVPAPATA